MLIENNQYCTEIPSNYRIDVHPQGVRVDTIDPHPSLVQ